MTELLSKEDWSKVPAGICEHVIFDQLVLLEELRNQLELELQLCITRIDLLNSIDEEQAKIKKDYATGQRK